MGDVHRFVTIGEKTTKERGLLNFNLNQPFDWPSCQSDAGVGAAGSCRSLAMIA
jgi:hypothetical protein